MWSLLTVFDYSLFVTVLVCLSTWILSQLVNELSKTFLFLQCLNLYLLPVHSWTKQQLFRLYDVTIVWAVRTIYLKGPSFYGYGFWAGASETDICAQLTTVNSQFWHQNPKACQDRIEQQVQSFLHFVHGVVCLVSVYKYGQHLYQKLK